MRHKVSLKLCQRLVLAIFFVNRYNRCVVVSHHGLNFISLMANDVEYLFIAYLPSVSYLVTCLFISFAYFVTGLFHLERPSCF